MRAATTLAFAEAHYYECESGGAVAAPEHFGASIQPPEPPYIARLRALSAEARARADRLFLALADSTSPCLTHFGNQLWS